MEEESFFMYPFIYQMPTFFLILWTSNVTPKKSAWHQFHLNQAGDQLMCVLHASLSFLEYVFDFF